MLDYQCKVTTKILDLKVDQPDGITSNQEPAVPETKIFYSEFTSDIPVGRPPVAHLPLLTVPRLIPFRPKAVTQQSLDSTPHESEESEEESSTTPLDPLQPAGVTSEVEDEKVPTPFTDRSPSPPSSVSPPVGYPLCEGASHKSEECEVKSPTVSFDLPQSTDIISEQIEGIGAPSDHVYPEPAKIPTPRSTVVPPLPPTSRSVLSIQPTPELQLAPCPQPPFPSSLPAQDSEEKLVISGEEEYFDKEDSFDFHDEEKSDLPLPRVSRPLAASPLVLSAPHPIPSQLKAEARGLHDISSDESKEYEDQSSMTPFDPPQPTDVVSNEDEGFFSDNLDVEPAEILTLPSAELPLPSLDSRQVPPVQPTLDLTGIAEPVPSLQLPSISQLPPQISQDGPASHDKEDDPDEKPSPSLPPVGRPFVVPPPILTTTSRLKLRNLTRFLLMKVGMNHLRCSSTSPNPLTSLLIELKVKISLVAL